MEAESFLPKHLESGCVDGSSVINQPNIIKCLFKE